MAGTVFPASAELSEGGAPGARGRAFPAPGAREVLLAAILGLAALSGLYVLLPALAGLKDTWSRLSDGDPRWLVAAAGLEILSFLCYVILFRSVFGAGLPSLDWRGSYRITMAGVVATRLLATAGAGGVLLTV